MAPFQNIIYEKRESIAYITINRPQRMNAMDHATSRELLAAFTDFRDDDYLRVAILTGAGERAFSAGADLVAIADGRMSLEGIAVQDGVPLGGITRSFQCDKPIIAAVNGYCLAGGLELALCCDIRIAAENAQFGLPEARRALMPAAGGTQRLTRTVPMSVAMEMLLSGAQIDAQRALQVGLVSRVVPRERLIPTAEEIAYAIVDCGPLAVAAIKQAALRGREMTLADGLALETELWQALAKTEDAQEGPLAFAQKRQPQYKGR